MTRLLGFFIQRSLLVNMITLMVIVLGLLSMFLLKKDIFPEVDFDIIQVSTSYPGAGPEDVEKMVTIPIERKLREVDGFEEVNGLSTESRSIFYLKINPDEDIKEIFNETKNTLDLVEDLPDEVIGPISKNLSNRYRTIIRIALTGKDEFKLTNMAEILQKQIEQVQDVVRVDISGKRDEKIEVRVNLSNLNRYHLTLSHLHDAIKYRNLNLSAGKFESTGRDLLVRTLGEFESIEDISNVVVSANANGVNIKLKDIATVKKSFEKEDVLQRANLKRAVYLEVKKRFNADILRTTELVKDIVTSETKRMKDMGVISQIVDDLSFYVKRRLGILSRNGLIGMCFVFLCLTLFMNIRVSLMTAVGAPLAFLVAFIAMDFMGISLNLISMFALILVLGMLVDDAIIVSEYFYQNIEKKMKPVDAALKAARDTCIPVLTTVLTTMMAFSSLYFIGGIKGKFMAEIPTIVIICLLASLFECFFILPGHLAGFYKVSTSTVKENRWFNSMKDYYRRFLLRVLPKHLYVTIGFFVSFVGSILLATTMRFEMFPQDDARIFSLNLKGKIGTPLKVTDAVMKKVEAKVMSLLEEGEYEQVRGYTGLSLETHRQKIGGHYGAVLVYLSLPIDRVRSTADILKIVNDEISKMVKGSYIVSSKAYAGGPPRGKPILVNLYGDKLDELELVGRKIKALLGEISGVKTAEMDFEEGKEQIQVRVLEEEAKRLGVSHERVAKELRRVIGKDSITEIKSSDRDIPIVFEIPIETLDTPKGFREIFILNNTGRRISLSTVIRVEKKKGAFVIRRLNGKRVVSVEGTVYRKKTTPLAVGNILEEKIKPLKIKYPNVKFETKGEKQESKESIFELIRAAFISILGIFIILITALNGFGRSLVIMATIPLGLIGVIITFFVGGKSLNFMAMMGVIGLVGVVVNDSIVLVNFIIKSREEGEKLFDAVVNASVSRLRPVILTTVTTVAGLLPIAHGPSGDPFLRPMALSFAYGLAFATLVTLVFIPCCYFQFETIVNMWNQRKNSKKLTSSFL
ncbi:efflux RND transporter permease subunit [Bacteriovoracaceae bacterium]|nr:efflux RND transporter permease subunit [Bacteriovoracaceae bacterium]